MLLKIEDALKLIEVARNIIDEQQYCWGSRRTK
jgi:hypothetical protein